MSLLQVLLMLFLRNSQLEFFGFVTLFSPSGTFGMSDGWFYIFFAYIRKLETGIDR